MSAVIDLQATGLGDYQYGTRHHPAGTVRHHPAEYATFTIGDDTGNTVTLYFGTRRQAAALAEAAGAMFPEDATKDGGQP